MTCSLTSASQNGSHQSDLMAGYLEYMLDNGLLQRGQTRLGVLDWRLRFQDIRSATQRWEKEYFAAEEGWLC